MSTPYEPSPATSHVYGWRPEPTADGDSPLVRVAFKPNAQTNTVKSEYVYTLPSPTVASVYLDKFRQAAHPGHVVNELKAAGVPCRKVG